MIILPRKEKTVEDFRRVARFQGGKIMGVKAANLAVPLNEQVYFRSPEGNYLARGEVVSVSQLVFVARVTKYFL